MRLPDISHLQFAVLGVLLTGEHTGRAIRAQLRQLRVRQTGPAFYQMMARLEDDGLVDGCYAQKVVAGQVLRERRYSITDARPQVVGRVAPLLPRGHPQRRKARRSGPCLSRSANPWRGSRAGLIRRRVNGALSRRTTRRWKSIWKHRRRGAPQRA